MPDVMKTKVPTIERIDSRPMPHTPWPEVHPEPNCVP